MTITEKMIEAGKLAKEALRHADIDLSMVLPEITQDDFRGSVRRTLDMIDKARACLTAALASEVAGEPAPVAWRIPHSGTADGGYHWHHGSLPPHFKSQWEPLFAAPPKPAAVPTREEIEAALCKSHGTAQCAAICLSHFASSTSNGKCPEKRTVYKQQADAILALLTNPQVKA